jgi:hypothetical protein
MNEVNPNVPVKGIVGIRTFQVLIPTYIILCNNVLHNPIRTACGFPLRQLQLEVDPLGPTARRENNVQDIAERGAGARY